MQIQRAGRRMRYGYSLVELLIVIGIIALLAVLILSAINRAREMSRRTVCLSNIRQLTQAWQAYAADDEGGLCSSIGNPQWLLSDPQTSSTVLYTPVARDPVPLIPAGQLWPYLKSRTPYICPADPQLLRNSSPTPPGIMVPGGTGTSYTMNFLLGLTKRTDLVPGIANLRNIHNAPQQMVFFEGNDGWLTDGTNFWCEINSFHPSTSGSVGTIAVSFADGHAIMWQLAKWGSEQRSWVTLNDTDNRQFDAFLIGADSPDEVVDQ